MNWHSVDEILPEDQQVVLAYLPDNYVSTPGDPLDKTLQPIKILKFVKDFYGPHKPRHKNSKSDDFWSGEGLSNHFFQDVSHWMPLPDGPQSTDD